MSQSAIAGKNVMNKIKEWEDSSSMEYRRLPENTPEEVKEWFATDRTTSKKRKHSEVD